MRHRALQHGLFECLCACLICAPCAVLAQQAGTTPQSAAAPADESVPNAGPSPQAKSSGAERGAAQSAATRAASGTSPSAAHEPATPATKGADDLEPAVDTSAEPASTQGAKNRDTKQGSRARASGKAVDHLELGTTDITGNRELPKVMYIVPWKRSDLGDLTGKPLNSLVDQTLEPVDRNVFERANHYYDAVTAAGSRAGAASGGASQDVHRTAGEGSDSAVRDER